MSDKGLKIPPQSIDSEMAFLGAVMLKPESLYDVMDLIQPETFYTERHKEIYRTMVELFGKGKPIDLVSLSNALKEKSKLDFCGGNKYLSELTNAVPSATNIRHYGEIIQKKYLMRRLIDASEYIAGLGYDEKQELDELLDKAEKKVYDVTNFSSLQTFEPIKDMLGEAFERLEELSKSDDTLRGTPTGFKALDNKLSGFQKSDLIILAARPSMGKTTLALDIARRSAIQHGTSVGVFSLEMSSQQLIDRMLGAEAQVDGWKLRTGKIKSEDDFARIQDATGRLSEAPIYIDDTPGNNILAMRSVCRRLKSERGLDLIIVDYLQLMMPTQSKNSDNVVQQVTEISRGLKSLARELDVPVIALSQLSRAVEQRGGDGKPKLSDLRDSGSIEQDADVVMFIHNENRYRDDDTTHDSTIVNILVEKHRNGPVGRCELFFDPEKATFADLDKSDYGSSIDTF